MRARKNKNITKNDPPQPHHGLTDVAFNMEETEGIHSQSSLDRRFVLFESNFNYIELIRKLITEGNKTDLDSVIWLK